MSASLCRCRAVDERGKHSLLLAHPFVDTALSPCFHPSMCPQTPTPHIEHHPWRTDPPTKLLQDLANPTTIKDRDMLLLLLLLLCIYLREFMMQLLS